MLQNIFLYLDDSDQTKNIEKLKQLLKPLGAEIDVRTFENKQAQITITYDDGVAKRKTTRNAGRPTAHIGMSSIEEINQRIKESNAETVAAELGISRATLFRKLKYAKETNNEVIF